MHTRALGHTGIEVGAVAFGCWRFGGTDVATARARIETALECGITLVDTADVYGLDNNCPWGGAEDMLGQVFADAPQLRAQLVIATKGGIHLGPEHGGRDGLGIPYDSSPAWITHTCEESLRRLRIDVIDLYQIHRPDLLAHPAEVAEALASLVESGKVRHLGVSNYTPAQLDALRAHLELPLVTIQPEFSLANIEAIDDGVLDQAMQEGLTPLAWSPLAGGALLSAHTDDPRMSNIHQLLDELAEQHSTSRTGIALAFILAHPAGIIPIVGTGKPERIREAAAATDVHLTKAQCYQLIAATGRPLP